MAGFWPFCVAASRAADYALIAAPDFLVRAGELDFFRNRRFRLTEPMVQPEALPVVFASLPGTLVCVYRAERTSIEGKALSDEAGRALYHAIGFLTDHPAPGKAAQEAILARCLPPMQARLCAFLANQGADSATLSTARQDWSAA